MAQVKILIEGEDVTQDLSPYLRGVSYEDVLSGKTDSLSLELMDLDALFLGDWHIERGATVNATLIHNEEEFDLGSFEVDELNYSYPPSVMKVKCNSCPQNSFLRQVDQSKSWENVKLSEIAKDIADAAQVELFYETEEDPTIERAEQGEKSPLSFLESLCRKYYLIVKFSDGQIVIYDEQKLDDKPPDFVLSRGGLLKRISIKETLTDVYKSCQVNYNHERKAETFAAQIDDPNKKTGKTLKINRKVSSQAEAEKLAANELREKNKDEFKLTLTSAGDFRLIAGNVFDLEGFGVYDGRWLLEKATHSIGKGYEVRAEARRCLHD